MMQLELEVDGRTAQWTVTLSLSEVLLAGYTGRNRDSVLRHIDELRELGVAAPPRVPMVYVVQPDLVTTESHIVVAGNQTSGEVEFFLAQSDHGLLVGVGSDHTDRNAEAIDVAESKRLCPKIVSRRIWLYEDVSDHWDKIEIRSWVTVAGQHRQYQAGRLSEFMSVQDLLTELRGAGYADLRGRLVFGGTIPALSGFLYGERFECALDDPVLGRTLRCAYEVSMRGAERPER
jgi:hypothetical protein